MQHCSGHGVSWWSETYGSNYFVFEKIPLSCVHRRHVMVIQSKLYLKYKNLELLLFQNGLNGFGLWVSLGRGARAKEEGNCLIAKKFDSGAFGQEARFLQFLVYITRAHLRTTMENVLVLPSFPWTGSNRTPVTLTKYQSWLWQLIRSCQLFSCQSLRS